ncbi:hypothetical protein HC251_22460 [Iamia sp. SCSIO 61187]|uniref:hypothetical protein n=1 Tax=Iamia sp. SCSIO 61187 TaxID=2722752 RepID=UPI001C6282F9|nr:hypothetical protein [Iamia sp. SCSIO 61187]QYG94920.1 hypothetical protein HC251_22460 [Iamia sp. SCSIO 61187]
MGGLPEDLTHAWWGGERAVPIAHALDALLGQMDRRLAHEEPVVADTDDLLPLGTGLLPLDRVLGGGVWRGRAVIVEADIEAQATALLSTVARHVPHRCLVDGRDVVAVATGILAGSAGVPEVSVTDARLSEREWAAVVSGLRSLRGRDVSVCSTGSLDALREVAVGAGADVLVVHDTARFGPPAQLGPGLARLARTAGVAVLASATPTEGVPSRADDGVTHLHMHGFDLGGRASLVRPDPDDLLAVAQVDVECLFGIVR